MSNEQEVRETWNAFCAAAKEAKGLEIRPGANINSAVLITEIGGKPEEKPAPPEVKPEPEEKASDKKPLFSKKLIATE